MDSEKMDGLSMDIEAAEREKLQSVFPQCFTEGRLDIDKLLNLCGEYITDDFEKYEFKWKGKSECLQLAGKRSTGTLRPCPEESVDWENTRNLYIEGDNLEVLKLLQTSFYRKVKMIYIDPPYNTGNDFVYADDFADPLARYREVTQQTTKSNPETMGRFHTNWLNMMYPRLRLAANLLRDDGVIFISIDDNEVHNFRKLCDEIFGEENFVDTISWFKKASPSNDAQYFSNDVEYILVYAKSKISWSPNRLPLTEKQMKYYQNPDNDPRGAWNSATYTCNKTKTERPNLYYPIKNPFTGMEVWPKETAVWAYSQEQCADHIRDNLLFWGVDGTAQYPRFKKLLTGHQGVVNRTLWHYDDVSHTQGASEELKKLGIVGFSTPKPTRLIKRILQLCTTANENDIILDFFSGSATTAHAVMQLNAEDGGNRRYICVQLPEVTDEKSEAFKAGYQNICEIGKERIRRAGAKIYKEGIENWTSEFLGQEELPEVITEDGMIESGSVSHHVFRKEVHGKADKTLDIGFRVFKLDSSNLKIWDDSPLTGENAATLFEQRMLDYLDVLVPGRTAAEVVYEVMLKLGQDLCEPILSIDLPNGRQVYGVGADVKFIVCLAPGITPEDANAMADYAPGRIIFAEQCFENTEQKSNVRLTLKDLGISIKTL